MTLPESTAVDLLHAVVELASNCSREKESHSAIGYSARNRFLDRMEQIAKSDSVWQRHWNSWRSNRQCEPDIVELLAFLLQFVLQALPPNAYCDSGPATESSVSNEIPLRTSTQQLASERINDALIEMPSTGLLRQTIHVVMRLVTLENRYASDLDAVNRRVLYNMAYGLSHELNNPLAIISANASQLLRGESDPKRRQCCEAIIDNASRGHEMIADVMYAARLPSITPKPTLFREFLQAFIAKCQRWSGTCSIELTYSIDVELSWNIDANALTEALWAVVRNAIEASGETGSIHVSVPLQDCAAHLLINIDDSGCGLSRSGIEHCFDPYYCGKEAGRNLGVGLFKARRICELHGGSLHLKNLANGGCRAAVLISSNCSQKQA